MSIVRSSNLLASKALASLDRARLRRFKCGLYIDLNEPPLRGVIIWGLASGSLHWCWIQGSGHGNKRHHLWRYHD
jgi:hypothetical protein